MTITAVAHNPERSRYELTIDGDLAGVAEYEKNAGGAIAFTHTVITPSLRDQGLGAQIVQYALDDARAQGRTVVAECWYVAQFIDEHPEYADLLAT